MNYRDLSMAGALSLSGEILKVDGIKAKLEHAVSVKRKRVVVPEATHHDALCAVEANGWVGVELVSVADIKQLINKVFPCGEW